MNLANTKSGNLNAIASNGALVEAARSGTKGCTLAAGTYYFALEQLGALISAVHLQWSAALAATITVEVSNFPRTIDMTAGGVDDVTEHSATAGEWVQLNPTTAYVPISGGGNSVTNLTITAGGANAGAAWIDLGNLGSRRTRIKVVVTVQGVLRVGANGRGC